MLYVCCMQRIQHIFDKDATEHETAMKCASSTNKDELRHKNADT